MTCITRIQKSVSVDPQFTRNPRGVDENVGSSLALSRTTLSGSRHAVGSSAGRGRTPKKFEGERRER